MKINDKKLLIGFITKLIQIISLVNLNFLENG
jgi:hypothetical protein